ncbi:DUF563 domain-containing protein [Acetobacter sp. DsW_063]|uniref:glycosyltransferase family 61 protein n=1 Tax=Acetobacter sp. DsW_063 TaxID=1514894 RepID=UPI001302B0DA|nr:glycosyltransferase 61 family protein [Acetobacter sp. DsW_063]
MSETATPHSSHTASPSAVPVRFAALMQQRLSPLRDFVAIPDGSPQGFPPMLFGEQSLALFGVTDEWLRAPPTPVQAWKLDMEDVVVRSASGVIGNGRSLVVEDSLDHTTPKADGYKILHDGAIDLGAPTERLAGCWLSLLLGNSDNYFHFVLMNLARLFVIDAKDKRSLSGVLVPKTRFDWQREWIDGVLAAAGLSGLPRHVMSGASCVSIERLSVPWGAVDARGYCHPGAAAFIAGSDGPECGDAAAGDRIYVDRRESPIRPLENEDELAQALADRGFATVRLERMSVAEQRACFAHAAVIVAPHGAGLTNLVFCRRGARVIEVMPHTLLNWCYRRLAAIRRLDYDCVLSRSGGRTAPEATVSAHRVAVDHVLACL